MPHLTHATRDSASVLRHACTSCGGCCQGWRVPVYSESEADRVRQAASELQVELPIDQGALRLDNGRCVFLTEDDLCQIHAELGADRKPIPCLQFPLVAVAVDDDVRIGVDPASYGAWRTWSDGPKLPDGPVVAQRVPCPGGDERVEHALVTLCERPDTTTAELLSILTREPATPGRLPTGFATRWARHLSAIDLNNFLDRDGPGPRLTDALRPIAQARASWSTGAPNLDGLSPQADAWVVEATRRTLWLRRLPGIPNASVAALVCLGGGLAAAWSTDSAVAFNDAFSAWQRALRFELFWSLLAQSQANVLWLATGQEPPG